MIQTTKRILATLVSTGLLTGISLVTGGGVAQADCPGGGRIYVTGSDPIRVTYSWGDPYATDRLVYPGHWSSEYGCDTDGFRVPYGKDILCDIGGAWYRYKPTGWVKITDGTSMPCKVVAQV